MLLFFLSSTQFFRADLSHCHSPSLLFLHEVLSLVSVPCHPFIYPIQVLLSSLHQKLPFQVVQSDGSFSAFILLHLQHHLTQSAIPVSVLSLPSRSPCTCFPFFPLVVMSQNSFLVLPFLPQLNIDMLQAHPVGIPIQSWLDILPECQ